VRSARGTGGRLVSAVIGRDSELDAFIDFIDRIPTGPAAVLLEGEAGIGKTTLWEWAVAEAWHRGLRVMVARPLAAEAQLSFSALGDLLDDALDDTLPQLPPPQRHALEVALLKTDPGESTPDQRAVSVAFLGALRLLASRRPLLIAVDDVQWLDRPSSRVLAFALHRLKDESAGVLATLRVADGLRDPLALSRALPASALTRVHIEPLNDAYVVRLLRNRFGKALAFPLLQQVASMSAGNPFLAIQIAEITAVRGSRPAPGEPLPVPEDARAVVQARIDILSPAAKNALGVCALSARPTIDVVTAVVGSRTARAGLREAVDEGIVRLDGAQVTFAHPLLSAAAYESMAARERRALHRRLAAASDDPEERARHLALAADGPDASVASALDDAARHARARGAPAAGAELLDLAQQLTPTGHTEVRHRRTLTASECHFEAGDVDRARSLLRELERTSVAGSSRAEALLYLCDTLWCDIRQLRSVLQRTLEELRDGGRVELRIEVMSDLAWVGILGGNLPEGLRHAHAAVELAERLRSPAYLSRALLAVGHALFLMGQDAEPSMARAVSLQDALEGRQRLTSPRRKQGAHLLWAGDVDGARLELERDHRETVQRGQLTDLGEVLAHLADVEIRAGNWDKAAAYAAEGYESMVDARFETLLEIPLSPLALVEARRGDVHRSRVHAMEGLRLAEMHDYALEIIRNRSVLGFLELSLGNASGARDYLAPLPKRAECMGLGEPDVFPYVPDLVEALVSLGEVERAEPVVGWLEERGRTLDRPLAVATAARCRALIAAARGNLPAALRVLEQALTEHERVHQPFELARTQLLSGEMRRRHKQKRLARDDLRAALRIFDHLGARLWSQRARDGLRRVGERAGTSSDLTPTEERVAALVAEGHTNREVADALFVSVKTVEANLSRIYHKMSVRSRTELGRRIASRSDA